MTTGRWRHAPETMGDALTALDHEDETVRHLQSLRRQLVDAERRGDTRRARYLRERHIPTLKSKAEREALASLLTSAAGEAMGAAVTVTIRPESARRCGDV